MLCQRRNLRLSLLCISFITVVYIFASHFFAELRPKHSHRESHHRSNFVHLSPKTKKWSHRCLNESHILKAAAATSEFSFHFLPDRSVLVFSAFLDQRDGIVVRLVGAAVEAMKHDRVVCHIWEPNNDTIYTVRASVKLIRFGHNLKHETCFILCPLRAVPSPTARVGLSLGLCSPPSFFKRIMVLQKPQSVKNPLGLEMCLGPLYDHFNRHEYVIEFLELSRILGFKHFTFYNYSVSAAVSRVLREYEREGLVTIVPWSQMPFPTANRWPHPRNIPYLIHYFGQIIIFHDCLYRSMTRGQNRFIAFQDIDEVMVPRRATLADYVAETLDPRQSIANMVIPSAFFSLDFQSRPLRFPKTSPLSRLVFLRQTKREKYIFSHGDRSKLIVDAFRTVSVSVHWPLERVPGANSFNVPASKVLLHHYRHWKSSKQVQEDTSILRFAPALLNAVAKRYKELNL